VSEPDLTANARRVLEARYLRRDADGEIYETPEELFRRTARGVAYAELLLHGPDEQTRWEERFYELLTRLEFLPNSPTLMNAGTRLGQLSGCFVLPVPDSMEGIFESLKQMALVQKTGGGTGFAFSRLRHRGKLVRSTGGKSSGAVSFMRVYDCATEQVEQGGKRRGANMGVLRVDHPDIEEFVDAKREEGALRNFNISVGATDAFMEALEAEETYPLVDPQTGDPVGERPAEEVFGKIVDAAWRTGDPGLVFLDTVNRAHPLRHLGEIEATNPCGEIPLLPYESCNLGSVNLDAMIRTRDGEAELDREKLADTARAALRFLDDVVEVNEYPLRESADATRGNRKVGLGVMGFADALARLGIPYHSDRAVEMAGEIMTLVSSAAREASEALAEERGVFSTWEGSAHERAGLRVRNATRTAIAPTGTISIIAGTSPSIEPFYSLAYRRTNVLTGETLRTVNPLVEQWVEKHGLDLAPVMKHVRKAGTLEGLRQIPEELRALFLTAPEIPGERHLEIQKAFQEHVDNAVSKTINLPEDAEPGEIGALYRKAWEMGLKGITVFRHRSREEQVMEPGEGES